MRVIKNETTDRYEADPSLLKKFPEQLFASLHEGVFHLGGDELTKGVDVEREGYPAGQAVGAIHEVVPAGDLVHSIVSEAETVLQRLSTL